MSKPDTKPMPRFVWIGLAIAAIAVVGFWANISMTNYRSARNLADAPVPAFDTEPEAEPEAGVEEFKPPDPYDVDRGRFPEMPTQLPFDTSNPAIPLEELVFTGTLKYESRALDEPKSIPAQDVDFINPDDEVIGVSIDGVSRAYPLRIASYHEVINDELGEHSIAVVHSPFCGISVVYNRNTDAGTLRFDVTGLVYNSNSLLCERDNPDSGLWSTALAKCVSGSAVGTPLTSLEFDMVPLSDWIKRHPDTTVMSKDTGAGLPYREPNYPMYRAVESTVFPIEPTSDKLRPKSRLLCVWTDAGGSRAYPIFDVAQASEPLTETIDGKQFTIETDVGRTTGARISSADEGVKWMYAMWLSWYAGHPDTEVYSATD